ncbi:basement membrane-specific heparan sulfate proteoglycan core protein [Plakobranchus ocellatus]|uniref:Basement membrane-specific heparan sulfate proteoglycan core protein n=1 Tax=Plakobranchus ocellatus TaxID=259542 RepID=A0AAV4B9Z9_9GAST|nr:basement membrane-specific heparan sulfate proteoglycan core protein [Plakobranchus ocellatus]
MQGRSPGNSHSLNTNKKIYLGGHLDAKVVTAGRFNSSYEGCVRTFKMGFTCVDHLLNEASEGVNIVQCE